MLRIALLVALALQATAQAPLTSKYNNYTEHNYKDVTYGLVEDAQKEVDSVWNNYMMGLITDNERYNQVIDIWTRTKRSACRLKILMAHPKFQKIF